MFHDVQRLCRDQAARGISFESNTGWLLVSRKGVLANTCRSETDQCNAIAVDAGLRVAAQRGGRSF